MTYPVTATHSITGPDAELQDWVNANMSHIERVIVCLIACASKEEVSRLRQFLDEWDDEGFVDAWRDQLKPRS